MKTKTPCRRWTMLAVAAAGIASLCGPLAVPSIAQGPGMGGGYPGSMGGPGPQNVRFGAKERKIEINRRSSEPDGPPVARIEFVGNEQISNARIESKLTTRVGRPFRNDTVREDVKALFKTHWFYDVAAEQKDTPDGLVVVFRVVERPTIEEVKYLGNTVFDSDKLTTTTGLRAGKAMDPGLNKSMARRVQQAYVDKGYPFADVELLEGGKTGDRRVVMKITEGPRTKIDKIDFEGNTFVGKPRLRTLLSSGQQYLSPSKIGIGGKIGQWGIGGRYEAPTIEEDVAKLTEYYRGFGYLDVRVGRKLEWNEDKSRVVVTFVIEEGKRYTVRNVEFAGNEAIPTEKLQTDLRQVAGSNVDKRAMQRDEQVVRDEFGKIGFIHANVNANVLYLEDEGEVDLVYKIEQDLPRKVGEVKIRGNDVTKGGRIRALVKDIEPGTIADTTDLRRAQMRLMESRIFEVDQASGVVPTAQFDPAGDPLDEFQDVIIDVQESATGSLLFGVGVNSDNGVAGSIVLNERNFDLFRVPTSWADIAEGRAFRGAMQEFRLEAVPGNRVQRYSVNFRDPMLFGLDYSLSTSGYFFKRIYSNYDEERVGGRFTLGKRFTRTIGASATYRIENVGISQPIIPTPADLTAVLGDNFVTSIRGEIDHDTRDSFLQPGKGHYLELGFEQVFGDFDFPRVTAEGRQYWTLYERGDGSGKHTLRARVQVSRNLEDAPLFERFYAGGFQTIRGFDFRGVGPVDLGSEVGGDFMLMGGLEYQFPLTADDQLSWVFFVDSGTVERDLEIKDYRVTAGFGLRVLVPAFGPVPLAFDFGFPISKAPFDDTQVFSFFFGIFQ